MEAMDTALTLYTIRISGRLGATTLSAFPAMVHYVKDGETELTGLLAGRAGLFAVIADIEALGLELLEVREITAGRRSPRTAKPPAPVIRDPPAAGPSTETPGLT